MKTKRTIQITNVTYKGMSGVSTPDGVIVEVVAKNTLLLRSARKAGDIEVVNNYQLGKLREFKKYGYLDFIELN